MAFIELNNHLKLFHSGKVRETFELPNHPNLLLQVATDKLSIFDIVLNTSVPKKGAVLTAMTHFWLPTQRDIANHLVAVGSGIDGFLPGELRGNPDLQSRSLVIDKLRMLPVECVVRGYLTGSGWKDYRKTGAVCGIKLPQGLPDGSKLPEPIFTPATKAISGHDENISYKSLEHIVGERDARRLKNATLAIYGRACAYAEKLGIIIADTKFEFGKGFAPGIVLADEVLTPDSSRFWKTEDWAIAQAQDPPTAPTGWDKEPVRAWGKTVPTPFGFTGINNLDMENEQHMQFVRGLQVPAEVVSATTRRYTSISQIICRHFLEDYQRDYMAIQIPA